MSISALAATILYPYVTKASDGFSTQAGKRLFDWLLDYFVEKRTGTSDTNNSAMLEQINRTNISMDELISAISEIIKTENMEFVSLLTTELDRLKCNDYSCLGSSPENSQSTNYSIYSEKTNIIHNVQHNLNIQM